MELVCVIYLQVNSGAYKISIATYKGTARGGMLLMVKLIYLDGCRKISVNFESWKN